MAKLIEKTYGDALFETAVEGGRLDELFEEAKGVKAAFEENAQLLQFLSHPKISKEEKIAFIENVFKGRVSDDMVGMLVVMIKKGRQREIVKVCGYFIARVKEYKKIGTVYVTSAVPLKEGQKQGICEKLRETTQYEDFEIHYKVSEDLIGGMVIRIGDRVVDSSIKTKLGSLSRDLYNIQLT